MNIPDKLFYKIGEVCEYTDTQPYVLRFWESEFPLLNPQKNRSGQRIYSREDIDLVLKIKQLLYDEEYTIAGARKRLEQELSGSGTLRFEPGGDAEPDEAPVEDRRTARRARAGRSAGRAASGNSGDRARAAQAEIEDAIPMRRPPILAERARETGAGADTAVEGLERRLQDMEERWRRAEMALEQSEQARLAAEERCRRAADRLEAALDRLSSLRERLVSTGEGEGGGDG